MQINRHNYETFFLLYVDKELSAADREAVDIFVQRNSDLKMELDLLLQTVLKPGEIVLEKKDWLFMEEDITALQENLMLYADDELLSADRKTVETLLKTDETIIAEWRILQQTKLQPDSAVLFEDKNSLYRKEPGKIIAFKWWRAAAAAVLLGFGLWAGMSIYKKSSEPVPDAGGLAAENKTRREPVEKRSPENNNIVTRPVEQIRVPEKTVTTDSQKNKDPDLADVVKPQVDKGNKPMEPAPKENMATLQNNNKKVNKNLPEPHSDNINNKAGNENTIANVSPENDNNRISGNNVVVKTNTNDKIKNQALPDLNKIVTRDPNTITAIRTVNKAPDETNNNRYLDVDDGNEKRTVLGGFLRKAKRVLERTTSVKAGDGIKIAGFEIALK